MLLRLPHVRTPGQEFHGEPGRQRRGAESLFKGPPAGDGAGILSQQDADKVLGLLDLTLDVRDRLGRPVQQGLGLLEVEDPGHTAIQPGLHQLAGILPRDHGAFGDFEVNVEAPQGEIGLGDLGDEADHHALPDILGREQLGLRSLGGAAEFSPEVQLPAEGKARGRCKILRRGRFGPTAPHIAGVGGVGLGIQPGVLIGSGYRELGLGLEDARHRNAEVVVCLQGLPDQRLEVRIPKELPPGKVGEGAQGRRRRRTLGLAPR